jgi:hypothetical protein
MKNILLLLATATLILASCVVHRVYAPPPPPPPIGFQTFYDELGPHGQWVDTPEGFVWVPRVHAGWRPYYDDGHWAYTNSGWAWVSEYNWGWAPFHYGRWRFDNFYGWTWTPGYQWAPAWVSWRQNNSYYGWVPLEPGWDPYDTRISAPAERWVFVPCGRIHHPHFREYVVDQPRSVTIINNTTIINNVVVEHNNRYNGGPRVGDVEKASGGRVQVHNLRDSNKPGAVSEKQNEINIYRPQVDQPKSNGPKPSPRTYVHQGEKIDSKPVQAKPVDKRPVVQDNKNAKVNQTDPGRRKDLSPNPKDAKVNPPAPADRKNAATDAPKIDKTRVKSERQQARAIKRQQAKESKMQRSAQKRQAKPDNKSKPSSKRGRER